MHTESSWIKQSVFNKGTTGTFRGGELLLEAVMGRFSYWYNTKLLQHSPLSFSIYTSKQGTQKWWVGSIAHKGKGRERCAKLSGQALAPIKICNQNNRQT